MSLPTFPAGDAADLLDPRTDLGGLEGDWREWLRQVAPSVVTAGFAAHHERFWEWLWAIRPGTRPHPFVAIWSRGAAKSSSAEIGCVALGARRRRRYGLYVSGIQDSANDHVQSIGTILESDQVAALYPAMGRRRVSKYGSSRGWRRDRLATASGFTIDALGLDTHVRGIKFDEQRPDLIVIDDIDDESDSPSMVDRKRKLITEALLPAATADVAVVGIQNLIHRGGIFAQLARLPGAEPADFLADRILSGPIPAVEGLEVVEQVQPDGGTRYTIAHGTATWEGMDVAACQNLIDTEGYTSFLTERQHLAEPPSGGLWGDDFGFQRCDPDDVPDLVSHAVWVDPAVTNKDRSDAHGIQLDGLAGDGRIFRLRSWEHRTSPEDSLARAIRWAVEYGCETVGVETDQGGDTWGSVFRAALEAVKAERRTAGEPDPIRWPRYVFEKAGVTQQSKSARAQQMLADYERPGRIIHVRGTHELLERALRRFPRTKPYDLVDAAYWSWRDLDSRRHRPARAFGGQVARARLPI